jgi:LPXTG-motif cell wall-anchored protein
MIHKMIVIAFAVVVLSAAPAAAQYGPGSGVEGVGANQGDGSVAGTGADSGVSPTSSAASGSLARTGFDTTDLVPLAAGLILAGALTMLVVRRRPGGVNLA